ncbi:phage tail sheath C-terminal domain-containing protein [Clostridium magnum]|uniref:Phage tail sheath protein n=1 Tax=Clostridium magnum DSM 2767 TaxID=1121326 RepID=A0A168E1P7_9CLOT|nr:phage tail sheath C-terminal domain-containing protein [Clostridium magnum]KZL93555.1 phage tail sheath protein [Clostridium magnum DSM 2767]SHI60719.1 Phage tail sheath protein [Clostridium magnum DSM 2767]
MAIKQPDIDISFKQRASSFVERSARGNVILILKDDTDKTFSTKEYKLITDVEADSTKYTSDNLQYIKDCMEGTPNKVIVVRIDTIKTITDALNIVATLSTGWISTVGEKADYDTISTWTKQIRTQKKTFKSTVCDTTTAPNCEGVVDLFKTKVTFKDNRGEQDSQKIIPTILGLLAGANVTKGTTYLEVPNLASVVEPADVDAEIAKGKMVLVNDEGTVKIALGINSLTTFTTDKTEDLAFVEIVEAQDLMFDDIRKTFKSDFISKYKNKYDNQVIFLSAVNSYLKDLAKTDVLDSEYENKSSINVELQRAAWIAAGYPEAQNWDETKVKNMSFKRQMFLSGQVKILFSVCDLKFDINMM